MMRIVMMMLAVSFLVGCKDVPYREQESTLNLDGSTVKNAAPVDNVENEVAKAHHEPSITDAISHNIGSPPARPDVIELEERDSNNRRESSGRSGSNSVVPSPLPPVNVVPPSTQPAMEEEANNPSLPKIEITSPINNSLIADRQFELIGSIEHSELIRDIRVHYRGISENNISIDGEKNVNKTETNFNVMFENLPDGDYRLSVIFTDNNGIEYFLPNLTVSIDQTPPKILGSLDGIVQPAYLQETTHFEQKFINDNINPRYEIEPAGDASPLKFETPPTIYRWFTRVLDEKTAPAYAFKIDDTDLAAVKYAIEPQGASFEKSTNEAAKREDGSFVIKIIPSTANLILDGKKYCLSIWATDLAGNKSTHQAEFIWKMIAPPVALDMNAARYQAQHRLDDISGHLPVRHLFRDSIPIALKQGLIVGHTIISNPFSSGLAVRLEMTRSLNLKVNDRPYQISASNVAIKFFVYDLAKNEIGPEKILKDGFVLIDGNETLVAQFILARDFPLTGVRHPTRTFWRSFSLQVGFTRTGNRDPLVDGLKLITRDSIAGLSSSEFVVPWGKEHVVRRKVAPRERRR